MANNLNDITKDNPDIVIGITKQWLHQTEEINAILKHACRTLLKQGNLEIMGLFGYGSIENIKLNDFTILTPKIKIGDSLEFAFQIANIAHSPARIRLEYAVYYQKANTSLSKKVYKISEKIYPVNSTTIVKKTQSFKLITTRKFHIGKHQLSIIINGVEHEKIDFELMK